MASRGLFSYDYLHMGQRPAGYFQVAGPSLPLHITALPPDLREKLQRSVFEGLCFRRSNEIPVEAVQ